jgi:hypothetical protein
MKLKIITNYIVLAFLALQLISCDNKDSEDALFDATATERINARTKELNDALKASEFGWKAVYFTDNTQLGGFTHLFKFEDGGIVDMASDFDDTSITPEKSRYSIDIGSTVSLVFTTKNRIHLLSENNVYPTAALVGQGYKGDFQFLYYGQENGQLIFRTNRSFQELRFVRAEAKDWTDLAKNRAMVPNLIGAPTRSVFRFLETNDGTTVRKYDFNLSALARFATANSLDAGLNETKAIGIAYTPNGITISPAIEVKGQKLTNFIYDGDATGSFTATGTGGVTASIKYSPSPLIPTDDYKFLLTTTPPLPSQTFGYIAQFLSAAPTNSVLFKNLAQQLSNAGRAIVRVEFYFNTAAKQNYVRYQLAGVTYIHVVKVVENAANKSITLQHDFWAGGITPPLPSLLALDAQLVSTSSTSIPIYVKKESFRITYTNTIYTFANSNGFRITTYQF